MKLRTRPTVACAAALTAAAFATACNLPQEPASVARPGAARSRPAAATPPPALHGEAARAADTVGALGRALRAGDVERLCHPGAIFTKAVVHEMATGGGSCEAWVEDSLQFRGVPATVVTAVRVEPDLATAQVRVRPARTVPLTLVRDGRRWLISFSGGNDPLSALTT